MEDERKVRINELLTKPGQSLGYEYDFGDSWSHVVELEKVLGSGPDTLARAVCIDGAGACPPEDCGGMPGYEELLRALKNPKHPEHRAMKRWLGKPFESNRFLAEESNDWLAKLKWTHVTAAALRRVLVARDGA